MKARVRQLLAHSLVQLVLSILFLQTVQSVPVQVPYSGQLAESGEMVNGNKQMQFKLLDGLTEVYSAGPISVSVAEGLFQVYIGGAGMPALDHSIFQTSGLTLRVLVEGESIIPDVTLAHAPYAAIAEVARSVESGAVLFGPVNIADAQPPNATGLTVDYHASEESVTLVAQLNASVYFTAGNSQILILKPTGDVTVAGSLEVHDSDASPGSLVSVEAATGQLGNLFEIRDSFGTVRTSGSIDNGNNVNWNFGNNVSVTGTLGLGTSSSSQVRLVIQPGPSASVAFGENSKKWCFGVRVSDNSYELGKISDDLMTKEVVIVVSRTNSPTLQLINSGSETARLAAASSSGRFVVAGGSPVDNDDAEIVVCSANDALAPGALLAYSGGLERLTILPTGNVGINESSPDATLHVSRPAVYSPIPMLRVTANDGTKGSSIQAFCSNIPFLDVREPAYLEFMEFDGTVENVKWRIGSNPRGFSFGNFDIYDPEANQSRFFIEKSSGMIGIGLTAPDSRVHVSFPGNNWDGTTPWIRLSSPLSTRAGFMVIPEVNDEVLVVFEGDLSFKAGTSTRLTVPESGIEVLRAGGDVRLLSGGIRFADNTYMTTASGGSGGVVTLQSTFPPTQQIGHLGVTGTGKFGDLQTVTFAATGNCSTGDLAIAGSLDCVADDPATAVLEVRAATGQTGNYLECRDELNNLDAYCDESGTWTCKGIESSGPAGRFVSICVAMNEPLCRMEDEAGHTGGYWECRDDTDELDASCDDGGSIYCKGLDVDGVSNLNNDVDCDGGLDVAGSCTWGDAAVDVVAVNGTMTCSAPFTSNSAATLNMGPVGPALSTHTIDAGRPAAVFVANYGGSGKVIEVQDNTLATTFAVQADGEIRSYGGGGGGGRVKFSADGGVTTGFIRGDAGGALHFEAGGGGGGGTILIRPAPLSGVVISPGPTGVTLNQGDCQVMGSLCATGFIGPCSDERLKQNITPIEGALEKIEKIEGKNYEWNREEFPDFNFSEGNQIGVIAQNVKEVIPEAVSATNDGYLTVDYGRITAVLIEAVKEQQKQIEELKAKVASLEKSPERAQLEK